MLAGIMHSLKDGCVANIANQFNNLVIPFLLKDQENNQSSNLNLIELQKNTALTILYQSLSTDIIPTTTRKGDILGSDSRASLIKNSTPLKEFYISPNLLNKYIKKYIEINKDYSCMFAKDEQNRLLEVTTNSITLEKDLKKEVDKAINEEYEQVISNKTIETTMGESYVEHKDLFGKSLQDKIDNILSKVPENDIDLLKNSQSKLLSQLYISK